MTAVISHPEVWQRPPLAQFTPWLRELARPLQLAKGCSLFVTGQTPSQMFYVAHGEAVMSRTDRSGRLLILQRASGGFLAEASLRSTRYHCDATALSDCALIALPVAALHEAIDQDADTRWAWIGMLSSEIRRQRGHAERLALKTVRERLLHLLITQGEDGRLPLPGSKKDLAAELGVSHEALYRTLAMLQREGVLRQDDQALMLC